MSSVYDINEVNKILRDSRVQIWNTTAALSASRTGQHPRDRSKYTLADAEFHLRNEIANVESVQQFLDTDVSNQFQDMAVVAEVIANILKNEKAYLETEAQVAEFIPRFQNFMGSMNYFAPAIKNVTKLNIEEGESSDIVGRNDFYLPSKDEKCRY
ncbi:Oidioi.mRNA.OKI2018_I69.chr1.g2995.t1.cds [Oikopleura dioica]|uniref:Oidioi.mRNA.OKI2018_I69.chr1.g2995.t1.cds n=1 Tax=Oikopleura dioica TaxID=34765 RepID=A0ABN7SY83_OIKDI|nr:Oidioi.mRNA.OKI2018_I69.chr1.g2995.t1.cds [Oikopleura dioica]